MERPTPSDMMPKRDHERDLELDKKIEALRRKNEALMKRYKEVEEDKKRAEEEGMALQSRKGKADDLTITINKSTSESRVVVTKPFSSGPPAGKGQQDAGPDKGVEGPLQGTGRGHRKQLMVTMAGKKGKRMVSEKPEKKPGPAVVKSPTDDGQAKRVQSAGRVKQQLHMTKKETTVQESETSQATTDLNIPTSKEEQEEYLRWKKEREQIDRERVARHKNAKGQWRRAWDMDKTENIWQVNEEGESLKACDTTLEEFLEELDALTDTEAEDQKDQDSKTKLLPGREFLGTSVEVSGSTVPAATLREDSPTPGKAESSSPRGSEKKVRFSEKLIHRAHTRQTSGPQDSVSSESRSPSSLKMPSPKKNKHEMQGPQQPLESAKQNDGSPQDQGGGLSASAVTPANNIDCTKKESPQSTAPGSLPAEKACASLQESSLQPVELTKCNMSNTNTEELIDSGLSVLSLEPEETHPPHSTSSDKVSVRQEEEWQNQ
uniref:uncharacterized protein C15orf52 isoform X5 n=1 Tax=Monopterus albus TaxID=43700 RepID=UPI0009B3CA15|nr:uncharacterized protein C15orf52 homolog isoform X5 [Monopterus albus]